MIICIISKQLMFSKQSYETIFQSILVNKYCKEFHIVDHPNVMFSLAEKTNYEQCSEIKQIFTSVQHIQKKFLTAKEKQGERNFYSNLKRDVSKILNSIYKCFELKKFALSEFFQYEQLVLSGFFQAFVEHLMIQCREKGQFVEFVWNQNAKIIQKMVSNYQRLDYEFQLQKNSELRDTHVKYSDFMSKQAEKLKEQSMKILNLKDIIEILVEKLRIRRKQVKKLFRQTQQLICIVNEFKDKNIELQMRYINLMESNMSNQSDLKEIAERKERLNYVFRQILTIENSLYKNSRSFQQEVHLEGPLQAEDFINEASEIIHGSKISNEEIKAEIDIILDKYEEDFEDTLFRLKKCYKRKGEVIQDGSEPFCQTNIKVHSGLICTHCNQPLLKPDKATRSTQVTNVDKQCNHLIKTIGVMARQQKKQYKNWGVQHENNKINSRKLLRILKTVQVTIKRSNSIPKDYSMRKIFEKSQRKGKFRASADSAKQDNLQKHSSSDSSKQSKQSYNAQIVIKNKKKKREQKENNLGIKSRFSLVDGSPRKTSYLHKQKLKMERIEEEKREYHQKVQMLQDRRSIRSSSSALSKRKDKRQSEKFQEANQFSSGKKMSSAFQNQKTTSLFFKEGQIKNIIGRPSNRTISLSRFSGVDPNSVARISALKQHRVNSRSIKLSKEDFFPVEREKVHQRISKLESKQRRPSSLASRQSVNKGRKQSKNLRFSLKQNLILKQGTVEQQIKKAFQKVYVNRMSSSQKQNKLTNKLILELQNQARAKSKEYSLKTRKLSFFIKHNNVVSIIGSVYARAYQKLITNGKVPDFVYPLYESMMIMYGNMPKQEIIKKISNFIAQVACRKKDQLCRSFVFFLGVDQDTICEDITIFDNHLYLKLMNMLSNSEKTFEDIQNVWTDIQRVKKFLPIALRQHEIGQSIIDVIVVKINQAIEKESQSKRGSMHFQGKVNLFSCCRLIVNELMKMKKNIKETFKQFMECLFGEKTFLDHACLHKLVEILSYDKIEEVCNMRKILQIPRRNLDTFDMNEFSTSMLMLNIQNFEDFCIKMFRKFKIVDSERYRELMKNRGVLKKERNVISEQSIDALMLKIAEEKSSQLLQFLIGSELTQLFSASILKVGGI